VSLLSIEESLYWCILYRNIKCNDGNVLSGALCTLNISDIYRPYIGYMLEIYVIYKEVGVSVY